MYSTYKALIRHKICKIFPILKVASYFFDSVHWGTKIWKIDHVLFIFFFLLDVLFLSYIRNDCLIQGHENLHLSFFSESFIVLVLTFRSLIYLFGVNFCIWCEIGVWFIFLHVNIQLSEHYLLQRLYFPTEFS